MFGLAGADVVAIVAMCVLSLMLLAIVKWRR